MSQIEELIELGKKETDRIFTVYDKFKEVEVGTYADWLAQTYYYVCHTTRLMSYAASQFDANNSHFHKSFVEHCADEMFHEKLAESDLNGLGFKPSDFTEYSYTSALYRSMYYMIGHQNPISILGYALVLEGLCATRVADSMPEFQKKYSKKSTNFLRVHCEVDVGHQKEVKKTLERCNTVQLEYIEKAALFCGDIYTSMLQKILQENKGKNRHKNVG